MSKKNTWKDNSSFLDLQNTDISNNLKSFTPDHLNFLIDEDKVICWEKMEPKYCEKFEKQQQRETTLKVNHISEGK